MIKKKRLLESCDQVVYAAKDFWNAIVNKSQTVCDMLGKGGTRVRGGVGNHQPHRINTSSSRFQLCKNIISMTFDTKWVSDV